MELLLQQVTGLEIMFILDRFSGYNQVLMAEEDKYKTAFATLWGTYAFNRISYHLKNTRATFQRVIDHDFKDLIGNFMVYYQNDLTVHTKSKQFHFKHLREVFIRCRMFGISLNTRKCLFVLSKGQLLGHIISGKGNN